MSARSGSFFPLCFGVGMALVRGEDSPWERDGGRAEGFWMKRSVLRTFSVGGRRRSFFS